MITIECGICAKRVANLMVTIQGKEIFICKTCNQKWQLNVKAVA